MEDVRNLLWTGSIAAVGAWVLGAARGKQPPAKAPPSPPIVVFVKEYRRARSVLVDRGQGDSGALEYMRLPRKVALADRIPEGAHVVDFDLAAGAGFREACLASGVSPGGCGVYALRRYYYDVLAAGEALPLPAGGGSAVVRGTSR